MACCCQTSVMSPNVQLQKYIFMNEDHCKTSEIFFLWPMVHLRVLDQFNGVYYLYCVCILPKQNDLWNVSLDNLDMDNSVLISITLIKWLHKDEFQNISDLRFSLIENTHTNISDNVNSI